MISCQDNKSKDNKAESTSKVKEKDPAQDKISAAIQANKEDYGLDTITKVKQKKLIPFLKEYGKKNPETKVRIKTDYGIIEVQLYEDTPLHRANFIRMAKLGYFNTTYFYRVDPGFVIQGGNSDERITSRLRKRIGDFLIPKEFKDDYKHEYGAFSAAKFTKQNVSKASSPFEFFIVMDKEGTPHLDEDHTVYGKVVKGMEVAEKISKVKTSTNSEWPVANINIEVEVLE